MPKTVQTPFDAVRRFALEFPEAHEDHPWGETVIKVRRKIFVFLSDDDRGFRLTVKLPHSNEFALLNDFAAPTGYGLGKSGWITLTFKGRKKPPLDRLKAWIEESYRAVAPKRLSATLPKR